VGVISGEAHPAEQTKINMPPAHLIDGQPLTMGHNPLIKIKVKLASRYLSKIF